MSERPFGSDVNRIWLGLVEPAFDGSHAGQGKANFRIAWHWQGAELFRTEKLKLGAEPACFARNVAKGSHDAIDLRMPSVGRDEDFHAKPAHSRARRNGMAPRLLGDGRNFPMRVLMPLLPVTAALSRARRHGPHASR